MAHENSIEGYHATAEARKVRTEEVMEAFRLKDFPRTDREISRLLGYADMNAVRPRITELIEEGILIEAGKVKDPLTNRTVRVSIVCEAKRQMRFA
jgi:DNA-binding Lrp family transcriptional regulator